MERREHYDPEDIEQLLMERGFDELLDEERAYVLRHLSGREEYEAMRSLLMTVQRTETSPDLLDPEEAVRDRVLEAFREQHRPGWRVWLNSVGATLLPRDASAMWRPALALGAIALLIGAALWLMRPSPVLEVAELNGPKVDKDGAVMQEERPAGQEAPANSTGLPEAALQPSRIPEIPASGTITDATAPAAAQVGAVAEDMSDDAEGMADAPAAAVAMSDDEAGTRVRSSDGTKALADTVLEQKYVAVTNSGYTSNFSLANAQGAVTLEAVKAKEEQARAKRGAKREEEAGKPLADDRVLALLRAAW
jgi:hypothetical protein